MLLADGAPSHNFARTFIFCLDSITAKRAVQAPVFTSTRRCMMNSLPSSQGLSRCILLLIALTFHLPSLLAVLDVLHVGVA